MLVSIPSVDMVLNPGCPVRGHVGLRFGFRPPGASSLEESTKTAFVQQFCALHKIT